MTRRKNQSPEDQLEEDIENLGDDQETPTTEEVKILEASREDADKAAEEEQKRLDKAAAELAAQQRVDNAKTEVRDLEEKLVAAKKNLEKAELDSQTIEVPEGQRPCCLPSQDPTLRTARSRQEAHQMVDALYEAGAKEKDEYSRKNEK